MLLRKYECEWYGYNSFEYHMLILQCTNSTIMMTKTIIIYRMIMHCIINMWYSKLLYPYKHNNLTYLLHDEDCFNNEECDIRVKFEVGMW